MTAVCAFRLWVSRDNPPGYDRGSTVFGRFQRCDYLCHKFATWQLYWLATAAGPRPG